MESSGGELKLLVIYLLSDAMLAQQRRGQEHSKFAYLTNGNFARFARMFSFSSNFAAPFSSN